MQSAAGASAALTLASQMRGAETRRTERRSLFFNFSHEPHQGRSYFLVLGKNRYQLKPTGGRPPVHSPAYRRNRFLQMLPQGAITHMLEVVEGPADAVVLGYTIIDPDTATGTYEMSSLHLLPPPSAFAYAYEQARNKLTLGVPLPLSPKRKKYGVQPAVTLQDLMEEQDLIDTTTFATTLVNLHPELLSADPNSAAHIQTNHIQQQTGGMEQLDTVLSSAPPASPNSNSLSWGQLIPYTDTDGVTPLKGTTGNNKGLILYDTHWNPVLKVPYVSSVLRPALQSVKNDTTLGADVTSIHPNTKPSSLQGTIWNRSDGSTSVNQTQMSLASVPDNENYVLSNITPDFNGYSLASSVTFDNGAPTVTLKFKNWYLRWLGLFIQFYDAAGNVVPASQLPSGISNESSFDTANNELFLGTLTPEFTIFGIPVQSSGNTITFPFPTSVASSANVLASGLGFGSHTNPDTELVGVIMTSIFNLSLPALLIAFGIGATVDAAIKTVVIPFAKLIVTEVINAFEGGSQSQIIAIFWRSIVKGITNPSGPLKSFLTAFLEYLVEAEVVEGLTDAIPLVGAILQAIGALGAVAEIAETSVDVVLSPWTYAYALVGTYDLSVTIYHDPKDPTGFPASAATYKVTAIFDNGTPIVTVLNMPGTGVSTLPPVSFANVPLGGKVTITVGFYTVDGTHVGHGTTGAVQNTPGTNPTITITEERLPLGPGVLYMHKQKTMLDAQGDHVWACSPAPAAPEIPSSCQPNPGNICAFRDINYNTSMGYIGYGWQSYNTSACTAGGAGQLDQIANIPGANGPSGNAQTGYATVPCSLQTAAKLVYDPLGR
ncbi:MAG: hypothetical protein M3Y72_04555, partial [Acidobacteriota bacterium]|nr:hypothetical protein [Acidobacteriota bacterium]